MNVADDDVGAERDIVPGAALGACPKLRLLREIEVRRHVRGIALARRRSHLGAEMDAVDLEALIDHHPFERRVRGLQTVEQVPEHGRVALGFDREVRIGRQRRVEDMRRVGRLPQRGRGRVLVAEVDGDRVVSLDGAAAEHAHAPPLPLEFMRRGIADDARAARHKRDAGPLSICHVTCPFLGCSSAADGEEIGGAGWLADGDSEIDLIGRRAYFERSRSRHRDAMALRPILVIPDAKLRQRAEPVAAVDAEVRQLVEDMFETMYKAPGIGLAAPQIGVMRRVVVLDVAKRRDEDASAEPMVLINPEIIYESEETAVHEEGCLSIPDFYEEVERPAVVHVQVPRSRRQADRDRGRRHPRGVHPARD